MHSVTVIEFNLIIFWRKPYHRLLQPGHPAWNQDCIERRVCRSVKDAAAHHGPTRLVKVLSCRVDNRNT
jgi:hypothetical protein